MRRELSCRDFIAFISEYLDGDLPPAERARFEQHLAACPDCVTYLDGYRQGGELSSRAFTPDAAVPDNVPEDLVRAIVDARRRT